MNNNLENARAYLQKNRRIIKYTVIARLLEIDKNILKDFIEGKTDLKPDQQEKIIDFVKGMQMNVMRTFP